MSWDEETQPFTCRELELANREFELRAQGWERPWWDIRGRLKLRGQAENLRRGRGRHARKTGLP